MVALVGHSQTSVQNFGTGAITQTSQTGTAATIPNPTSGTTWSRAGAVAPAAPITISNATNPLGSTGSYIRGTASTSTSVAKMSPWVAYNGSTEFYTSFKALFGDASGAAATATGSWTFYQGAGGMYSDNSDFAGAQVFTGLRFTFGASGAITLTYRGGSSYINTGLTQTAFNSATVYTFEIVGNNKTSGTINYSYNGNPQSVAVQKFDLYVNGTKIGDDLAEALLPANTNIVSGTFIGISSASNLANIFVDDAVVYNAIPALIGTSAPSVTTDAAPSAIAITTATLGGNVTAENGSTVNTRGVVYSETSLEPTPAIGAPNVTDVTTAGTTGAFSIAATSLSNNTQYSYRAYAINNIGTTYGGVSGTTFYTLANTPNTPVVGNPTENTIDVALGGGDGNPATTVYAIQETSTGNYVQAGGALGATAFFQTATNWSTTVVTGLNPSTTYTFQVKARNGALVETSFGGTASATTSAAVNPTLFGSALTGFGNVCTGTTAGPNTFTITGANLTNATVTVSAPTGYSYSTDDITYTASLSITQPGGSFSQLIYVKFSPTLVQSYDGNIVIGGGGASSSNISVTGSGINTTPSVTTGNTGSVSENQATMPGNVSSNGCSALSSYGIEYSVNNGFADGTGTQAFSSNIIIGGDFDALITGLAPATTYYYKAFATNNGGTSYGVQASFTTLGLSAPTIQPATTITTSSFDANWLASNGATSYRLDVSTSPTFGNTINATDLFISEYIEASGNNKYIEIYNGTGASVDLSNYKLRIYTNGSATPSSDVTLSGILANGGTVVYRNAGAVLYAGASTSNTAVNFNGDDAMALFNISLNANIDIIGRIGEDPGTSWTAPGGYSTENKTLVRKATVLSGVSANPGAGFPTLATEWDVFLIDDVTHLGAHTINNTTPSYVFGYENLTVNALTQTVSGLSTNTTYYYRVRAFSATSTSPNSAVESVLTACDASVDASTGANGTVVPIGLTNYTCGDNIDYIITPQPCYNVADVLVDGISVGAVSNYTFNNIVGAHTISATFVLSTYNVTASAGAGGSISSAGVSVVNCGDDISYNITPDACYSVADVIVDGNSVGAVSSFTFTNVNQNHTIAASFIVTPYTISVSSGAGGSISPATGTVSCGSDATYTITPDACNSIVDVLVDGVSVGAASTFTFTNVIADHTISATFAITTYTITATAGANGSVTPSGISVVDCGSNNTYTITPNACYSIADVIVDGVSVGAVSSYDFNDVATNHTISASFSLNPSLTAPVVTGSVNVCANIGNGDQVTYTANSAGATGYSWITPPNVTVVSGAGTANLTVTFQNGFAAQANKQIRVTALSSCGNSPQVIYYLVAQTPGTPAAITGNTNVCPIIGTPATYTYSISAVPGASSYIWTAQAGTTVVTNNGTSATVSFSNAFTTSAITVQAVNGCGTSNSRSIIVSKVIPSTPGLINGPTNACAYVAPNGVPATYSVAAVAGSSYNWVVPPGAIGVTGQGTSSISFTFPTSFTSGTVSVTATNGCGTSGIRSLSISKLNPATPSSIDVVELQACPSRQYSYTVASLPANAVSVEWTVPAEALSFTGQGTTSITVSYPTTIVNGFVTAKAVNNCGVSTIRSVVARYAACEDGPPPPPPPFAKAGKGNVKETEGLLVNVYPNPSVSDFKVQVLTAGKEKIIVRITDMQGRSIKNITVQPFQTTTVGSDLKSGAYMIEVKQGNSVKTTKLIKF